LPSAVTSKVVEAAHSEKHRNYSGYVVGICRSGCRAGRYGLQRNEVG